MHGWNGVGAPLSNQRKKKQARASKPSWSLHRVTAEIRQTGQIGSHHFLVARFMANDLTTARISVFTTERLVEGMEVAITLEHPLKFYVQGKVEWCKTCDGDSQVVTQQPRFKYRSSIRINLTAPEIGEQIETYRSLLLMNRLDFTKKMSEMTGMGANEVHQTPAQPVAPVQPIAVNLPDEEIDETLQAA